MNTLVMLVGLFVSSNTVEVKIPVKDTMPLSPLGRIYNGSDAEEGEFPYMVFLKIICDTNVIIACSGSLVSKSWVLTASHCLICNGTLPETIYVIAGKADLTENFDNIENENRGLLKKNGIFIRKHDLIKVHPKFDKDTLQNDIGLIKITKPFVISDYIQTIKFSTEDIEDIMYCMIIGWGSKHGQRVISKKLQFAVDVKVSKNCVNDTRAHLLCLYGNNKGICHGDSGGPLVCDGEVWGVASTVYPNTICGNSSEEHYTNVYYYHDWIEMTLNSGSSLTFCSAQMILILISMYYIKI